MFGTSARQTQVCNAWKDSPDHYANIISPDFTTMGVACWFCDTADGQYTYWTVTFG
ncbi:MAG: CAP domain-containing protein [Enterocloster bolteae]